MRGILGMCFSTIRPLHFDYAWSDLIIPVALDFETGREVKGAVEPAVEFVGLVSVRYPHSAHVFSDASRDDSSGGMGVGFCAPSSGYRFGIRLASFTSIFSAELNSIFCALKYILRIRFPSTVVFTDSL